MENMSMMKQSLEHESMYDEGDGFYAQLRRQILSLTADDEELLETRLSSCKRGVSKLHGSVSCAVQPGNYFNWWESTNHGNGKNSVPTWLVNLWRNGHGTGVFIPQIVTSRRKHKHGRTRRGIRCTSKQMQRSNSEF